jgi:hypothetical protein
MSTRLYRPFFSAALAAWSAFVLSSAAVNGQQTANPSQLFPTITIDNVPLSDAIRNLAQQADFNYMLDPGLTGPFFGPDGKMGPEPTVTLRWENLSAGQALARLLKEHGLRMAENPVTTVTRITYTNQVTRPFDGSLPGGSTNVIPLMRMQQVPLADAITRLATDAHLNVIVDPSLSNVRSGPGGRMTPPPAVSFRWRNLTATQALTALCENYDLVVVKDAATGVARIKFKDQQTAK